MRDLSETGDRRPNPLSISSEGDVNLREKYENWERALGISWDEYLKAIAENANTGDWVKELCHYLLEKQLRGPSPSLVSESPNGFLDPP